jgi:hypothetical protein
MKLTSKEIVPEFEKPKDGEVSVVSTVGVPSTGSPVASEP